MTYQKLFGILPGGRKRTELVRSREIDSMEVIDALRQGCTSLVILTYDRQRNVIGEIKNPEKDLLCVQS